MTRTITASRSDLERSNGQDADRNASQIGLSAPPFGEEQVRSALRQVVDPEMGLNIVDLGLIYEVDVYGDEVQIQMTLTSPSCPMGPQIVRDTKNAALSVEGVSAVEVSLVWEPYWTSDRIDPRVRLYMGL